MRFLTIAAMIAAMASPAAAETITAVQRDFIKDVATAMALDEKCDRAEVNYSTVTINMFNVGLPPDTFKPGAPTADLMSAELRRENTRLSRRSAADACADATADFGPLGERQPDLMTVD